MSYRQTESQTGQTLLGQSSGNNNVAFRLVVQHLSVVTEASSTLNAEDFRALGGTKVRNFQILQIVETKSNS